MNRHFHLQQKLLQFIGLLLFATIAISFGQADGRRVSAEADSTDQALDSYIIQGSDLTTVETAVTQIGGHVTHQLNIIDGVAADLTGEQYTQLSNQSDLTLSSNGVVSSASSVSASTAASTCAVYSSTDVSKAISSSGTPSISSVINVPFSGTITDLNVLNLQGTHTYVSDLDFNLISPQGTEIQFFRPNSCGSRDNFSIGLDDEAGSSNFPCAPTDGNSYQPQTALSAFDNEASQGVWTLRVDDNYNADGGSLNSWELEICTLDSAAPPAPSPTPVLPEPTTVAPPEPPAPTPTPAGNDTSSCTVYDSNDVSKSISASGQPTINSVINIPVGGTITDLNVLNLQGTHTYVGDLDFNLISPQGTEIPILDTGSCNSQNNFSIGLDDEAGSGNFPCPPTNGNTYQPHTPLSTFDNEESQGVWTLRINDSANQDGGSLDSWGLEVCTTSGPPPTNPTPPPPTVPPSTDSAYADLIVRDEFSTSSYANNDGTATWNGDWDETDSSSHWSDVGGASTGKIEVANGRLKFSGASADIQRYVDLKDTVSATLSFRYKRNLGSSSDSLLLMFKADHALSGGHTYIIDGPGSDTTWQQVTIDLTPYLENPGLGYLRFETASTFNGASWVKIDDIQISYRTYAPDVDYPTLVNAHTAHNQGVTGAGVGVAVVDTGIGYEGHVYFDSDLWQYTTSRVRVDAVYDAINNTVMVDEWHLLHMEDGSGHGTHVTSIIASSQNNNENGRKNGIAPEVTVVPVRAFNNNGTATYADVIRGIDWIVANKDVYNIRVINASFFSEVQSYYWEDPLNQAMMRAWQAGIVVVASAGNIPVADNHAMTIGAPGNIPYIITVGGMTDSYTPDDPTDDRVLSFSALGPTAAQFVKPDVVAPGGHIRSYMSGNSHLVNQHPHLFDEGDYFTMSGTSQSAAVVSGIVALMLEEEPNLTPDDVKCRLMMTARATLDANGDLAAPIYAQGAGMVDAFAAVNSNASGCANQGLDIAADLAGTHHYVGHVEWDDLSQEFVIYNDNGAVIDGVSWSGGNGFMSGGNGFMSGGNGFMSGGNGFMSGGNGFMSGGNGFMSGGNGFMSGGNGFMSGTTPWNASITWSETPDFTADSASINTWIDDQE